jgi:hypothetical protein
VGEVRRQKKSPLSFLTLGEKSLLRKKFHASNNLDWLLTLICWYIRDNLLRAFPASDLPAVRDYLLRRMGEALHAAILEKLRQYHPNDANRDDSIVLRYYPYQTAALLYQAQGHLIDVWRGDFIKYPKATLAERCQRLLPSLAHLPQMRGKPAHGKTSQLFTLVMYEDALRLLSSLRRRNGNNLDRRKKILADLRKSQPDDIHPQIARVIAEASENDLDHWAGLSKKEVALEIAARAVKGTIPISSEWLRHLLSDLKAQARRLHKALKRS